MGPSVLYPCFWRNWVFFCKKHAKNRHSRSAAALKPAWGAGFNAAALREWRFFYFWRFFLIFRYRDVLKHVTKKCKKKILFEAPGRPRATQRPKTPCQTRSEGPQRRQKII